MKIAVFEIENWEQEAFDALKADHEIEFASEKLSGKNASSYSKAEIISTFIYSELDRRILAEFENLKLIATRSTGFDHIDLDYCREKGIAICNVPTYGSNTVAEHVLGLLLTISHHLVDAIDRTRRGDFSLKGLTGFDLLGKTLGVIGTGDIGARVIEIGRGFGMRIVAYDTRPQEELAAEYGFRYANLDDLLSESDIISLHIPDSAVGYSIFCGSLF